MKKFDRWKRGEIGIARCPLCGKKTLIVRKNFTTSMSFFCGCGYALYSVYCFEDLKDARKYWGCGR